MKKLMVFLYAGVAALFPWQTVAAKNICAERTEIIDTLSKRYHEVPVSMGLAGNGGLVEILASKKGSWTIIVTRPSGVSCVVSTGEAWELLKGTTDKGSGV